MLEMEEGNLGLKYVSVCVFSMETINVFSFYIKGQEICKFASWTALTHFFLIDRKTDINMNNFKIY